MKAQRLSLDMMSTLPPVIIENILCLVPIQEAVRTSILSREWRYKWTKIPKLEFADCTFEVSAELEHASSERKQMTKRCKLFNAISQVLELHQGPILEFTLSVNADKKTCAEIGQIILHLSRNTTIQKVNLDLLFVDKLPLDFFSLHQLTGLHFRVSFLDFEFEPTFNGFGQLTTLNLENVSISKKSLIHLLSNCPLLKTFNLRGVFDTSDDDKLLLVELFGCLRVIEHLTISLSNFDFEVFIGDTLPTSLVHLKYLCLEEMCFLIKGLLPFLFLLIKSSPNLEKIKLKDKPPFPYFDNLERDLITMESYSDMWLGHLKELEIEQSGILDRLLEFVKVILAKSPVLKKVNILLDPTKDQELETLRILLEAPHASPRVHIIVEGHIKICVFLETILSQ